MWFLWLLLFIAVVVGLVIKLTPKPAALPGHRNPPPPPPRRRYPLGGVVYDSASKRAAERTAFELQRSYSSSADEPPSLPDFSALFSDSSSTSSDSSSFDFGGGDSGGGGASGEW